MIRVQESLSIQASVDMGLEAAKNREGGLALGTR